MEKFFQFLVTVAREGIDFFCQQCFLYLEFLVPFPVRFRFDHVFHKPLFILLDLAVDLLQFFCFYGYLLGSFGKGFVHSFFRFLRDVGGLFRFEAAQVEDFIQLIVDFDRGEVQVIMDAAAVVIVVFPFAFAFARSHVEAAGAGEDAA